MEIDFHDMNEYKHINAKELITNINNIADNSPTISISELRNIIAEMPDIVRCKDCIFSNSECTRCSLLDTYILEIDYCSWGERKDDNDN